MEKEIDEILDWLKLKPREKRMTKKKLLDLFDVSVSPIQKELDSRRIQIIDINQWSQMGLSRRDLTMRVVRSLFCDINNRTTD
mgnify:CR=1 FL=1|tara:strand:- start:250 stop:498 length:249 start_codon:yes stop_codon:yes gene_type:complete